MEKKTFEYTQEQDKNANQFSTETNQNNHQDQFFYTNINSSMNKVPRYNFSSNVLITALSLYLLANFSNTITLSGLLPVLIIAFSIGIFGFLITIISIIIATVTAANSRNLLIAALLGGLVKVFGSALLLMFLDFLFGNSFTIYGGLFTAVWVYFIIYVIQSIISRIIGRR